MGMAAISRAMPHLSGFGRRCFLIERGFTLDGLLCALLNGFLQIVLAPLQVQDARAGRISLG